MELHALKVSVTEDDLNRLLQKHLPKDQPVEDAKLKVLSEGVWFSGTYPLFINVKFEILWEPRIENGVVHAKLSKLKALGIPGNVFRSAILKAIGDLTQKQPGLSIVGEDLRIDVDHIANQHLANSKLNLRSLTCSDGLLVLEAGN